MEAAGESHGCSYGSRTDSFLRRITSRRSRSFQQLLLMEAVGGVSVFKRNNGRNDDDDDDDGDNDISLPGYECLTQSMRSPEDSDPIDRNKQKQLKQKQKQKQMQKLMQYVFARRGGAEDDDDVKAMVKREKEKRKREKEMKKKKRSSWLPDPEKRWPIQGWG